ncbi:hypothetical protein PMI16_02875 [Herbaspirillum sp. CF444]|uniref:COG3904 family protein n=1 Tax=Herbaspirillum sp. CF444 TaxID=1144319 RepID=UPI00027283F7|nr:hypothetical protein [Herbaspirillum sp. CF444]EJL87531.1 hypothetical protein PMI16_02875 [Herbaspirillum sp. CF444]
MNASTDIETEALPAVQQTRPARQGPAASFFRRHLRGDYSLGRSYWLHMVVFAALLPRVLGIALTPVFAERPARYGAAATLLVLMLGWLAWIWGAWGTWMSAGRHVQRGGKRAWANVARTMLVFGLIGTIGNVVRIHGVLGEYTRTAFGAQLGPETVFEVRADGRSILLKGGINDDTAERFVKTLDAAPSVRTVVLYSSGGWVTQGRRLAKIIAARGLDTYVEQDCASACTIAFLAGKSRAADPAARIGFHAFHSLGGLDEKFAQSSDEKLARDTYGQAGLSPAFINRIVGTSHNSVWYPSHDELLQAGVLTRTSLGGETATLATVASTREKLEDEFKRSEVFDVLSVKYPDDFQRIVDDAWKKAQDKRPDSEIVAAARTQLNRMTDRLLPIASDKSLMDFQHLLLERAEALRLQNSEACAATLFPGAQTAPARVSLPREFTDREARFTAAMIRDSSPDNRKTFSKEETQQAVRTLLASLTPAQQQLLASPQQRAASPGATCAMVIAYLKAIDMQPEVMRKHTLRVLYSRG